jgi:hypothetical protein
MAQVDGQLAAPTPQSVFMKAADDAQKKLKAALEGKDLTEAENAAAELGRALEALRVAPSADDLRNQAAALRDRAKRFEGDAPEDLKTELEGLVIALAPLRGEGSADFLARSADALRLVLKKTDLGENGPTQSLKTTLDGLVDDLAPLRGKDSIAFLEQEATRLTALYGSTTTIDNLKAEPHRNLIKAAIDRLRHISPDTAAASLGDVVMSVATKVPDRYEPPWAESKFATAIGAAAASLDTEYKAHLWVKYFTDRANGISGSLLFTASASAEDKRKAEFARAQLVAEPDAMTAAAKLKTAVEALAGGYRPAIHIMAAGFGDIQASEGSPRLCDATLGLRTACQRKTDCKLPANYETTLCGYDPVPAAEDRIKAVTVFYACFAGGDPVWDELAQRPGRDPVDGTPLTENHPAVSRAVMRKTVNELRCPSEPASAGGSGQ